MHLITLKRVNKDQIRRFGPTSNVLIEIPIGYILETEQPVPLICHDKHPLVVFHFSLRVSTISQKTYNIFVLGLYQTFNLFMEFILVNIKRVEELLHGHRASSDQSLQ
jgi:hypothetical protein